MDYGLYKAEVIWNEGPWRGLADVELATLEWVHWFNHERLLEPIGNVPPAEFERAYELAQLEADSAVTPESQGGLTVPPRPPCQNMNTPALDGAGLTQNTLR